MTDYLIHYGVKGMKWGIRHDPERIGRVKRRDDRYRQEYSKTGSDKHNAQWYKTASDEEIRRERRIRNLKRVAVGAAVVAGAAYMGYKVAETAGMVNVASVYGNKMPFQNKGFDLSEKSIYDLNNKDTLIKEGSEIHRIEWGRDHSLEGRDKLYVNPNAVDAQNYRAILGKDKANTAKGGKYDIEYEAKNDIIAPSERKRVMAFMQKMQDPEFRSAFKDDLANYNRFSPGEKAKYRSAKDSDLFDTKHVRQYYSLFMGISADSNSKSGKMYRDELVRRGFNAVSDDNDANYLAKTPMIVINPNSNLVIKGKDRIGPIDNVIDKFKVKDFR